MQGGGVEQARRAPRRNWGRAARVVCGARGAEAALAEAEAVVSPRRRAGPPLCAAYARRARCTGARALHRRANANGE